MSYRIWPGIHYSPHCKISSYFVVKCLIMTFKFTTLLQWFKLGETFIESTLWIEWYHYDSDGVVVKGLDFRQVPLVESYMKSTANFGGAITYQATSEEDIPVMDANDFVDNPAVEFPQFLLLSQKKELEYVGIATCMDILLCDVDQQVKHDYHLDFALLGKVLGLKG